MIIYSDLLIYMYMYYVTVLVLHVLYMYRLTGTLSFALVKEKFKTQSLYT